MTEKIDPRLLTDEEMEIKILYSGTSLIEALRAIMSDNEEMGNETETHPED